METRRNVLLGTGGVVAPQLEVLQSERRENTRLGARPSQRSCPVPCSGRKRRRAVQNSQSGLHSGGLIGRI